MTHRREGGFTFLEVLVSTAITGLVVLLMMPSLSGYQTNAQVRALAAQIVQDLRAAEEDAISQDQTLQWWVCYDCGNNYFKVIEPGTGAVISQVALPPNLHVTGVCYRGPITPQGPVDVAVPPCSNPGATFEILCFDSHTAANPYGIKITIVVATGQVISTTVGTCS